MKKRQVNLQLDDKILGALGETADRYGLSANQIIAAAACELSRVKAENLWHALGRIADEEATFIPPRVQQALPEGKKPLRRAIPA